MFIVSNTYECCVNTDYIIDIYASKGDIIALISNSNKKHTVILARYENEAETRKALKFMYIRLAQSEKILYMPNSEQLKSIDEKWHHATGKKTKGHGGS